MVTLLLLALCLTSTLAIAPSGIYPGRSADIIIQSGNSVQDSVILLKGDQLSTTELKEIEDTTFADLFAHVMGTQAFHVDADRTGFPKTCLFNKPKASAVVVIDSVGAEILNKYPTLSLLQNSHAASIKTQSSPTNIYTMLANLATGSTPSIHGIVGGTWRKPMTGEVVHAYSENGPAYAANIADILLQETRGLSLVVSASSCHTRASALAAHPQLVGENLGWRAHAYGWNEEDGFTSLYEEPSCDQTLGLSASSLSNVIADVSVSSVTFSKTNPADLKLLVELAFVRNLVAKLQSESFATLVKDAIPDLYTFVFASLKGIQATYGVNSAEFSAALDLVDQSISSLLSSLDSLYGQRVASAIVALEARDTSSEATKQTVFGQVSSVLYTQEDFAKFYPNIYVRTAQFYGYTRDLVCSKLQKAVDSTTNVLCVSPFLPTLGRMMRRGDNDTTPAPTPPPASSSEQSAAATATVWTFWLNFFVTVILAAFILWGVYCLAYVGSDASKDSLLFRATGRHHHQN